jgi:hypothetical protein
VFAYNKKLFMSKYDRVYKDNLVTLMNEGFLDFEQNMRVLQSNSNRVDPAIYQLVECMDLD